MSSSKDQSAYGHSDHWGAAGMIRIEGAQEHNLKDVSLEVPRGCLVVFTGVSGSGKSSLAFGTLYAEAQRRYLETVAPYARRLFHQLPPPKIRNIEGLPPVIALQQQAGTSSRSSVGSVTTLSNLLRMLYSRAGTYPADAPMLESDDFSANTPQGACPRCQGTGWLYDVVEEKMVPDPTLTLREKAVAAWPGAWQGQNLRDILMMRGIDLDTPWQDLPKATREWILYTDETPTEPIYRGLNYAESQAAIKRGEPATYQGTFASARRYVMQSFHGSKSAKMRARAASFMQATRCPVCHGARLKPEALAVTFGGQDIAALSHLPLEQLYHVLKDQLAENQLSDAQGRVIEEIGTALMKRLEILLELGLGYLQTDRAVDSLSPGEYQRLRLGTQVHSALFGVAYVLDEPAAGLHPADIESLLNVLGRLPKAGNSLLIVEHDPVVMRHADWLVDIGPGAGRHGGQVLYSGPPDGLRQVEASRTRPYLFAPPPLECGSRRPIERWLQIENITWRNMQNLSLKLPLGVLVSVTGVSGSGKSSLVSQALVSLVSRALGQTIEEADERQEDDETAPLVGEAVEAQPEGQIIAGLEHVKRLAVITQKPIGRTSRSNLATYTGIFDHIRKLFAATDAACAAKLDESSFSFNVAKGRCPHCEGLGTVSVGLLFMPGVEAPCPVCHGARYKDEVLAITLRNKSIADVLAMTVDEACSFFAGEGILARGLDTLVQSGLGYLRLGQPAPELSGGEAQRLKLATELQKRRSASMLYILDEPTTGLHPSDTDRLLGQLQTLVEQGHSVVVTEHNMRVAAASDWVIDIGPGSGEKGGQIIAAGPPEDVAQAPASRTGPYVRAILEGV
ncbi:excinuclease ABC subunit A [Parasaccharibacter apium]|nr:excinuclease ABC subunit A [Parasaccharibacter apium]